MKKSSVLLLATCSLLLACEPSPQPNVSVNVNSPSSTPSPSMAANITSSPSAPSATGSDIKEAEYNGYPYSYKREVIRQSQCS